MYYSLHKKHFKLKYIDLMYWLLSIHFNNIPCVKEECDQCTGSWQQFYKLIKAIRFCRLQLWCVNWAGIHICDHLRCFKGIYLPHAAQIHSTQGTWIIHTLFICQYCSSVSISNIEIVDMFILYSYFICSNATY